MTISPPPERDDPPPPGLRRMRFLAGAVLWFERGWPALAPALGLVLVLAAIALLDLPRALPPLVHVGLIAASGVAVVALLVRGVRRIGRPPAQAADRRLELDSGLRHQPLLVLTDRPSGGGGALWPAHVARARAQLGKLRLRLPRPMLAAADPRALRALVLIVFAASLGIAGPDAMARLAAAFHPGFVPAAPPPAPLLQAWITPPDYTGQPPLFLKPEGGAAEIPAGSKLTVSLTGGAAGTAPTLDVPGHSEAFASLDPTSFQIEQTLAAGGRVAVHRQARELAAWELTVVADVPPVVVFPEAPGILRNGANPQARLPWRVEHAYGVASLHAELHLVARPEAPALTVPIPLPGNTPKAAKGARVLDLTAHPWAGLPVSAQLVARDQPGLEGRSEPQVFTLPERRFTNAVARAVAAVRRQLSLAPDDRAVATAELDRLSRLPTVWDDNTGDYINLRAILGLLAHGRGDEIVPQAQERLWTLALHIEEGAADRTARALEVARQQLRDALEAEKKAEPSKDSEKAAQLNDLDRRIRELQEALQKRLDALSEQARREPESDGYNPDAHPLDQRDMQKLTEEMRDATRKGDTDQTREKLAELDRLMDALKNGRPEHGQMTEQEKQRAEKRQRGQQQMSALQDMVQREGGLLDRAQARAPTEPRRFSPAETLTPATSATRTAEQRTQLALRRAVGELMQQYADLTGEVPPNLGDADSAMRDAAQAVAQGRDAQAAEADRHAIEALQKGGQAMQQQMAQQFGRGQQSGDEADDGDDGEEGMAQGEGQGEGQGQGDGKGNGQGQGQYGQRPGDRPGNRPGQNRQHANRPGQNRDPLGRSRGEASSGSESSGDVQVPEEMEQARTRALQDELRRRGADRTRNQDELDYIERLLRQF